MCLVTVQSEQLEARPPTPSSTPNRFYRCFMGGRVRPYAILCKHIESDSFVVI